MEQNKQLNLFATRHDTFISCKGAENEHYPFLLLNYDDNSVTYKEPYTFVFKEIFDSNEDADKFYNNKLSKLSTELERFNKEIEIPALFKYDTNKYSEYGYCKQYDFYNEEHKNMEIFNNYNDDTKLLWYQEKEKYYLSFVEMYKNISDPPPCYYNNFKILKSTQKILKQLLKQEIEL